MAIEFGSKDFSEIRTILKASGGGSSSYPLDLTLNDAGETYTGVFRPGTVNGLIPSNYTGLTGIAKTGTVYIKLDVTLSSAAPTLATFTASPTPPSTISPVKGVPPGSISILTHIIVDGTVLRVLGIGSPNILPKIAFETDKAGPIATGERNTDIWYTYQVTSSA